MVPFRCWWRCKTFTTMYFWRFSVEVRLRFQRQNNRFEITDWWCTVDKNHPNKTYEVIIKKDLPGQDWWVMILANKTVQTVLPHLTTPLLFQINLNYASQREDSTYKEFLQQKHLSKLKNYSKKFYHYGLIGGSVSFPLRSTVFKNSSVSSNAIWDTVTRI